MTERLKRMSSPLHSGGICLLAEGLNLHLIKLGFELAG
jgi:hypothetical protein